MESNYQDAQKLLIKDLDVKDPQIVHHNLNTLRKWLSGEIAEMMENNFQKLINVLYRIDINERKAKRAFASDNPADQLAKLIIERELKKVETRKKGGI